MNLLSPGQKGFTLLELLSAIAIVAVLAVALTPLVGSMITNAELARDTGKMRSYAAALSGMISEKSAVSASEILRSGSTLVDDYAGGSAAAVAMLNSAQWTKVTKPVASAAGRSVGPRTRSYTLNDSLFPPKAQEPGQPAPAPWEIDSVSPIKLREKSDRPLLYTGVYLAGHDGAYVWGGRSHANPVYDQITKDQVTSTIQGRTLVLFVGGDVRAVDFSKENLPDVNGTADPEAWWKRDF